MSDLPAWTCELKKFDTESRKVMEEPISELTVGRLFVARCEGSPVSLQKDGLRLELSKENNLKLNLIRTESIDTTSTSLIVTSYRVGEFKQQDVLLTDGTQKIKLEKIDFTVKSILDSPENARPFPPFFPLELPWPTWIWVFLGILLLSLLGIVYRISRKNRLFRQLRETLKQQSLAVSPYVHFNKELRALARHHRLVGGGSEPPEQVLAFILQLNEKFRWFLARELLVPAFDFSPGEVRRFLRRQDRALHKLIGRDLQVVLQELEKATAAQKGLGDHDGRQLLDLCRKIADLIARARGG